MNLNNYTNSYFKKKSSLLNELNLKSFNIFLNELKKIKKNKKKIILLGNGGSAAESQHFTAELMVKFKKKRIPIPAICLNTDTSLMTAHSNDFSYDTIFSRQLEALASKKDLCLLFSTSGKSKNIISAINTSKKKDVHSILFTGKKQVTNLTHIFNAPFEETDLIQEVHLILIHIICSYIDKHFD